MAGSAPTSRNRGPRDPVFVTIGTIKYGFQAGQRSKPHRGTLGHTAYTGQEGVVFGANSPKPNIASLDQGTTTVSSYIDPGKEETAKKAGWAIQKFSRRRGVGRTAKTVAVFVSMPGGFNYGWRMDLADFNAYGKELGIQSASGNTPNLVWGCSPKPARASKKFGASVASTFCDADTKAKFNAIVGKGWSVSGLDYDSLPEGA